MEKPNYRKLYEETGTIDIQWINDSIKYTLDGERPDKETAEKIVKLAEECLKRYYE